MKITNFEQVDSIEKFKFTGAVGTHESCEFTAVINAKCIENFKGLVSKKSLLKDDAFQWTGIIKDPVHVAVTDIDDYLVDHILLIASKMASASSLFCISGKLSMRPSA